MKKEAKERVQYLLPLGEKMRGIDSVSSQLKSDEMQIIEKALGCKRHEITEITMLKKGMTNRSFLFTVNDSKYLVRIPGEGTDRLINRKQEAEVFRTIRGLNLCDNPIYIAPENGFKITKYLDGVRACNVDDMKDLKRCMDKLRYFHNLHLTVDHTFDIFEQIDFYEMLLEGDSSAYQDYKKTKDNVLSLRPFIDGLEKDWCLAHIDAVPDNFLFYTPIGENEEWLQLTDWEYSGMQDPHVDLAMFCIYSLYNKQQCDMLINIYFRDNCNQKTRAKIYCYIAVCGLLWSNWCEYKRKLGVEFGEYSLRQYYYAKDFYRYAIELIKCCEEEETHIAKRAIIMAAGIGKRMQPLTCEIPKPLVRVNGVRMIDTVVKGLRENGITEIYVVIGHLKEQFYDLPTQYPGLHLIANPYYDTCNNISSLYVAREYLGDCIILDGDQIIYNTAILNPHFNLSGYNAVWCEGKTDEWLMDVEDGRVKSCSRTGGSHGWQLYSISRWTLEDGKKLRQHLEEEFESGNHQIYWDDVGMFCHFDDFVLGIYEMQDTDVVEIDGLDELVAIDHDYESYLYGKKDMSKLEEYGVINEK